MDQQTLALLSCFAALMSALATGFAAWAAIWGPKSAAQLAEKMRVANEALAEKRRLKLHIFTVLMRERASMASFDSVGCLNLIDVVFNDTPVVREAWAELYAAFEPSANMPQQFINERIRKLLKAMASEIGLSDNLRPDDFSRIYYPTAIAELHRIQDIQRRTTLEQLTGTNKQPPSTDDDVPEGWPPRPEPTKQTPK